MKLIQDVVVYNNLSEAYEIINEWGDKDAFPYQESSDVEKLRLGKLTAIEIFFDGSKGNDDQFDLLFSNYNLFLKQLIFSWCIPSYLFTSDFKSHSPSKVRSYKGILPKTIIGGDGLQDEVALIKNQSILAGLIKLNTQNFENVIELFADDKTSFIINSSGKDVFSKQCIAYIVKECMKHNARSILNYVKLISHFCMEGALIFRMGGDGGDRYITLQIFCTKEKTDPILDSLSIMDDI